MSQGWPTFEESRVLLSMKILGRPSLMSEIESETPDWIDARAAIRSLRDRGYVVASGRGRGTRYELAREHLNG